MAALPNRAYLASCFSTLPKSACGGLQICQERQVKSCMKLKKGGFKNGNKNI